MPLFRSYYQSAGVAAAGGGGVPGDVSIDAITEGGSTYQHSSPATVNHAGGTPNGVLVLVLQSAFPDDDVTGVTYGGVALSRVPTDGYASDTAIEPGAVYAYFLGSGVPAGTQDAVVSWDTGGSNGLKRVIVYTFESSEGNDLEIADSGHIDEDVGDPASVTLDSGSASGVAVAGYYSGENALADTSPLSGVTEDFALDQGAYTVLAGHQTTPAAGSFTIGWNNAGSDDAAFVAVMVADTGTGGGGGGGPTPPAPDPDTFAEVMASLSLTWWCRFGEPSGTTASDEESTQDGTYEGGPTLGAGGYTADGDTAVALAASQYVTFADNAAWDVGTSDFSFGMAASFAVWPSLEHGFLIARGNGAGSGDWALLLNQYLANRVSLYLAGTIYHFDTGVTLNNTGFHLFVVTCDRDGDATLYIDGVAVGTADISAQAAADISGSRDLIVGAQVIGSANQFLNGTADEAFLATALLDAATVAAIHAARNVS